MRAPDPQTATDPDVGPPAPPAADPLGAAQHEVAEIFGNIAAFWGFTRTQGRVYGLLFLSPMPLSHGDVQRRLDISAGGASMTLSSLVHWGVVRRRGRAYEPETDMWKVITGVFRRREREQVDDAVERIAGVTRLLERVEHPCEDVSFALGRARQLSDFFRLGRQFLDAFVAGSPVHGLLSSIAGRAARFRSLFTASDKDASFGH